MNQEDKLRAAVAGMLKARQDEEKAEEKMIMARKDRHLGENNLVKAIRASGKTRLVYRGVCYTVGEGSEGDGLREEPMDAIVLSD